MIRGMFDQVFGANTLDSVYEDLSINLLSDSGPYSSVVTVVDHLYDSILTPIALSLLCIYFLVAMVDKLSSEHFTWEQAVRQFCMLIAGFALIDYGLDLMKLLFDLGLSLTEQIHSFTTADSAGLSEATMDTMFENFEAETEFTGIGIIDNVCRIGYLLIPWVFSWIISVVVIVIVYSRVIEIYARACFAPIAFSDFFQNGLHGGGWRFLKSFLAIALQGALILIITVIFSKMTHVLFGDWDDDIGYFAAIGQYLAFNVSSCMLMIRSLSLAKEIVGVQ